MFDLRYHLASLAAVFVALAVGVLVGVAISGKISDAEDAARQGIIDELNRQLDTEREQTAAAGRRGLATERLVEVAYPAIMQERLADKRFGVVFLGDVADELRSAIERTLADAGSGGPVRTIALDLPLDPEALDERLAGEAELVSYSGDQDFADLGRDLGQELVEGDATPILAGLSTELVRERLGSTFLPVDGVVVVRSWAPPEPADGAEPSPESDSTETFVDGLLDGLDGAGVPVVGVELLETPAEESDIELFRERGISSVDDVDTILGRIALAVLLAGGEEGHYGVKETADAVAPPIEPVTAETSAE